MNINAIRDLAESADEPEIIPSLGECVSHTLMEVEDLLHGLIAIQGHPSLEYRSRVRASLLSDLWDQVYVPDQADYLRHLILSRIECRARTRGLHDLNRELRVLASLWDRSNSAGDLDRECEALEDWDYLYLEEHYLSPTPSLDAVAATAGRAIYYVANGNMSGMVSAHEAAEYFGW